MKYFKKNTALFFFEIRNHYQWITFFRISFGLMLLLHFILILPDFDLLFSTKGIISSDILDVFVPSFVVTLPKIIHFFSEIGITEEFTILLFKCSFIVFSVFLIIGLIPRIAALFLLFLQIAIMKGGLLYAYGVDYFESMSLFYLILIPSHYQYSVHAFLKREIKTVNLTPYRRLFQIHLSIAYFFSGFDKVIGFNWWNGESIWKAINLPFSNLDFNLDFSFLGNNPILLIIIGWTTIIIEMLYPIFIWLPKTRRIWLCLTISMHLGIALILNLYVFSAVMIIWNLTNFHFDNNEETHISNLSLKNNFS